MNTCHCHTAYDLSQFSAVDWRSHHILKMMMMMVTMMLMMTMMMMTMMMMFMVNNALGQMTRQSEATKKWLQSL